MATKAVEPQRTEVIEEALEELEKLVDRVKALYEQYFLGIQKQAPAHLHTDMERKIRDLAQENIRNTAQRYRFNMLQQKFGSYNAYWRRTMRQIENGTYLRQLSKVGRKAAQSGEAIPEEILAAMPKRMREQVMRDRAAAIALAKRQGQGKATGDDEITATNLLTLADEADAPAFIGEPSMLKRDLANERRRDGAFQLTDDDFDLDAFLREAAAEEAKVAAPPPKPAPPAAKPAPPRVAPPPIPASARATGPVPRVEPNDTIPTPMSGMPRAQPRTIAPSQQSRPIPIVPGSTIGRTTAQVPTIGGRAATPPTGVPVMRPPAGMSDGDVDALYSKYVAAKKMVGEDAGPAAREKLLRTINSQAPKIMEQYKAKGVDFSIVVKDNQVIIKAKPKP